MIENIRLENHKGDVIFSPDSESNNITVWWKPEVGEGKYVCALSSYIYFKQKKELQQETIRLVEKILYAPKDSE